MTFGHWNSLFSPTLLGWEDFSYNYFCTHSNVEITCGNVPAKGSSHRSPFRRRWTSAPGLLNAPPEKIHLISSSLLYKTLLKRKFENALKKVFSINLSFRMSIQDELSVRKHRSYVNLQSLGNNTTHTWICSVSVVPKHCSFTYEQCFCQ